MLILAFDTATGGCGLAVLDGDRVLVQRREAMSRGQAEVLIPWIGEALAEIGLVPADISAIASTTGPGAFTGIRIGLAAARGLALALDKPGIGIGCFDVFAAMAGKDTDCPLLVAVESKRAELYLEARYQGDRQQQALAPADTAEWLGTIDTGGKAWHLIGDGVDRLVKDLDPALVAGCEQTLPDPVILARLAQERLTAGTDPADVVAQNRLNPIYIRPADAKPARAARVWLADTDA